MALSGATIAATLSYANSEALRCTAANQSASTFSLDLANFTHRVLFPTLTRAMSLDTPPVGGSTSNY